MNDIISVIVPIYNVERYLRRCIESIINQTYTQLEIILVDDGSKDKSGQICDEYSKIDSRIITIHKENGGISSARNMGLDTAAGSYISFVDSDDYIHPKMLEILLNELNNNQVDVSICKEKIFYEDEEVDIKEKENECYEVVRNTRNEVLEHFFDESEPPFTYTWNKLYRREVIAEKRFVPGKVMEDLIFLVEISERIGGAVWVEKELYYYRQRKGSIMHNKNSALAEDYCYAILFEYDKLKNRNGEKFKEAILCKCLNRLAIFWTRIYKEKMKKELQSVRNTFIQLYDGEATEIKNVKEKVKLLLFRYFPHVYLILKQH